MILHVRTGGSLLQQKTTPPPKKKKEKKLPKILKFILTPKRSHKTAEKQTVAIMTDIQVSLVAWYSPLHAIFILY